MCEEENASAGGDWREEALPLHPMFWASSHSEIQAAYHLG